MPYIRLVPRTIRTYCWLTQSLSFSVCVCVPDNRSTIYTTNPIGYSFTVERYGTNRVIHYKHGYLGTNQVAEHMLFDTISWEKRSADKSVNTIHQQTKLCWGKSKLQWILPTSHARSIFPWNRPQSLAIEKSHVRKGFAFSRGRANEPANMR